MTDAARWARVTAVFHEALEREEPARVAYLDSACAGDGPLRAEVESLLASHQAAGRFAEGSPLEALPMSAVEALGLHPRLAPGSQFGSYTIVVPLGAGGMGEVYRARDTRLGRDVAIKALPQQFLADSDRVARFEREAQLLAALNHPNIATIYGLEESNGSHVLVLEFVEGESLAARIARGRIGLAESLGILRQIIDALESAHEKGIIHRDLKPANVMLTAEDRVKVLDFGLGKVLEPESLHAAGSQSPTKTLGATAPGVVLGTAAYMSPEQAKGRAADKRSDIWACGCVLYEMLAGKRAFSGDDASDTIAAVLRGEADWSALPSETPPNVRTLLKRCLEKDRKARVGDLSTVRYVLDEAGTSIAAAVTPSTVAKRSNIHIASAVTVGAAVATAITLGVMRSPPRPVVQPMRFTISSAADPINIAGPHPDIAIMPDGSHVVYRTGSTTARTFWVRRLDQIEAVPLRGLPTVLVSSPSISPDGRWLAFVAGTTLMKVALTGGPPVTVTPPAANIRGIAWGPDNTIIFGTTDTRSGLLSVPSGGGDVKELTKPDSQRGEVDHLFPSVLPGGRAVLFTVTAREALDNAQIAVLDLASGAQKRLIRGGTQAMYVESGHLVYAAGDSLMAVRFDLARLEVLSDPQPVAKQIVTKASGAANFSVSRNGTLVYIPGVAADAAVKRSLVWVTRQGTEELVKGVPPRAFLSVRLSPDGTRIAVDIRDHEGGVDIWVWDLAQETLTPLTLDPANNNISRLDAGWQADRLRVDACRCLQCLTGRQQTGQAWRSGW